MSINTLDLLCGNDYKLNDKITIHLTSLAEIVEYGEEEYFKMLSSMTHIPSEMKSVLWDIGIDYEEMGDLELFYMLTRSLDSSKTSVLLGDEIDLSKMEMFFNYKTELFMMCETATFGEEIESCTLDELQDAITNVFGDLPAELRELIQFKVNEYKSGITTKEHFNIFFDKYLNAVVPKTNGLVIDTNIHHKMCDYLRAAHGIKPRAKAIEKAATEGTKKMLIMADRDDRLKAERLYKTYGYQSLIEPLVIALVNSRHSSYDYSSVFDLKYYSLIQSINQIQRYEGYYFLMQGIYAGTVDQKSVLGKNRHALEWIPSTKNI